MKKTILACSLLSILNQATQAAENQAVDSMPKAEQTAPAPEQTQPTQQAAQAAPSNAPIDCNYPISPETTQIDPAIITEWTEKAAEQAFSFKADALDTQLEQLKACFTTQGWKSFYDALEKSGNITAIRKQNLTVSSKLDGKAQLNPVDANSWKLDIPLEVLYQNNQQRVNQSLQLEVLVGRKPTGELGIMQIVATPKQTEQPQTEATSNEAAAPNESTTSAPDTTATQANPNQPATPSANAPHPIEEPSANQAPATEGGNPNTQPEVKEPAEPNNTDANAQTPVQDITNKEQQNPQAPSADSKATDSPPEAASQNQ